MKLPNELQLFYKKQKTGIENRLNEFKSIGLSRDDKTLFSEMSFCLLTPQSKAKSCWAAVCSLKNKGLILKGSAGQIKRHLTGVRFANNKSRYIVGARKLLKNLKSKNTDDIIALREWLVKNVRGYGYKEASHFLRNIGFGDNIAILDRHILKNMKELGIISEIPKTITRKKYFEIENKLKVFSKKVKIPLAHLDLLFWSKETGEIFK